MLASSVRSSLSTDYADYTDLKNLCMMTQTLLRGGSDEISRWIQYRTDDEAGAVDAAEDGERDGRPARGSFSRWRCGQRPDERQSRNRHTEDRSGSSQRRRRRDVAGHDSWGRQRSE